MESDVSAVEFSPDLARAIERMLSKMDAEDKATFNECIFMARGFRGSFEVQLADARRQAVEELEPMRKRLTEILHKDRWCVCPFSVVDYPHMSACPLGIAAELLALFPPAPGEECDAEPRQDIDESMRRSMDGERGEGRGMSERERMAEVIQREVCVEPFECVSPSTCSAPTMERCLAVADAVLAQRAAQHVCTKCGYVTATLPVHALRARAEAMTANAEALKARVDLATAQEERDELRPALLPEPGA